MPKQTMDIATLKNDGEPVLTNNGPAQFTSEDGNNMMAIKREVGKNIDGKDLRDFGNGLKEFDPGEFGMADLVQAPGLSDEEQALLEFDKIIEKKKETVAIYNRLIDERGAITEEELREALGESEVGDMLGDKYTPEQREELNKQKQEYLDSIGWNKDNKPDDNSNIESSDVHDSDLDELERELESDDGDWEYQYTPSDQLTNSPLSDHKSSDLKIHNTINTEEEYNMPIIPTENTINENTAAYNQPAMSNGRVDPSVTNFSDPNLHKTTRMEVDTETLAEDDENTDEENYITQQDKYKSRSIDDDEADIIQPKVTEHDDMVETQKNKIVTMTTKHNSAVDEIDKDLAALEDDENEIEEPVNDFQQKIKEQLEKKMRPVTKKYDLSAAVVSSAPITVNNVITPMADKKIFTWGLYRSGRPFTIKAFTASELNTAYSYLSSSKFAEILKLIWDHIVDGKGETFESWAKCTNYYDFDNLWFGVYGACYKDCNYITIPCSKCNEVTVTTDIPINHMVFYKTQEAKEKMEKILTLPTDPEAASTVPAYRVQVSDSLVIEFKEPSLYDIYIARTSYDSEFKNKYEDIINMLPFIANIYYLDISSGNPVLRPIAFKTFVGNAAKTEKGKIMQYAKLLRQLTTDQYNIISNFIATANTNSDITYGIPKWSCEHCKAETSVDISQASELVFIRHQLTLLTS